MSTTGCILLPMNLQVHPKWRVGVLEEARLVLRRLAGNEAVEVAEAQACFGIKRPEAGVQKGFQCQGQLLGL